MAAKADSSESIPKKRDKGRKKDFRSWENIFKNIVSLEDSEKIKVIEEKYNDLYNEFRQVNSNYQQLETQYVALKKENDHNQSELTKSMVARARLENLCRELQKQNKLIKEENVAKIKEEEERRKEVSMKFAEKLTDINNMVDDNKEKSDKLREENEKMVSKLADLKGQFKRREDDIGKMTQQMDLERQYYQASISKMELQLQQAKEIHIEEYTKVQNELKASQEKCKILLDTAQGLQQRVDIYQSQYQDYETTMTKSNELFDKFKKEMDAMRSGIKLLEKEVEMWRTKYQEQACAVIKLTQAKGDEAQQYKKKIESLTKLSRQLQTDRAIYLKLLKKNNIEITMEEQKSGDEENDLSPAASEAIKYLPQESPGNNKEPKEKQENLLPESTTSDTNVQNSSESEKHSN